MTFTLNPHMTQTSPPPVMEARRWAEGVTHPEDRPLLNLSQAAPVDPPPELMRQAMAEMVMADASAHLYGPVLGLPPLRNEIARTTARIYGGAITPDQVAVTAGCNQAFCAVVATLAGPGDEVILPTPWYFNHKMALDMGAQVAVPLATGAGRSANSDASARASSCSIRASHSGSGIDKLRGSPKVS